MCSVLKPRSVRQPHTNEPSNSRTDTDRILALAARVVQARVVIRVLLGTLAFLHNKTIAHRDLKPENLLLADKSDDTTIKIADFGFCIKTNGRSLKQVTLWIELQLNCNSLRGSKSSLY